MEFHHIEPHDGDIDGICEGNEYKPASADPPIWAEVYIVLLLCFFSLLFGCSSSCKYHGEKGKKRITSDGYFSFNLKLINSCLFLLIFSPTDNAFL